MRVFHVGVFSSRSTNIWQADGFENLGHTVNRFDYRKIASRIGNKNRDNKIIKNFKEGNYDLLLVSKGNGISERVIKECNKCGKTAIWYMDPMQHFKGSKNLMRSANFVFCSRYGALRAAKKINNNVFRLQGGYNPKIHYPIDIEKDIDVSFMGSLRPERGCHVDRKEYKRAYNFKTFNNKYGVDHSRIVSRSKINLNFTNGDGVSNRIYKIMAARGFLLSQPWENMKNDWTIDKDIVIFNTKEEFIAKIKYYLEHEDERREIANHAYNTNKNYDNNNYAKTIMEKII